MIISMINLKVENWDRMVKFYQNVIGLKPIVLEYEDKYGWLDAGGVKLSIYEKKSLPQPSDNARLSLQFQVENIEGEVNRLEELGCKFFSKQLNTGEAYRLASFHDPEGNPVSIYELITKTL